MEDVRIIKGSVGGHVDERRKITEILFKSGIIMIPFVVEQVKVIDFYPAAIEKKMAVGNHYHTEESGRLEMFFIIGEKKESPVCLFRCRKKGSNEIKEHGLNTGDACFVPFEWTHSFLPLTFGFQLLGVSNLEYDSSHDVKDALF